MSSNKIDYKINDSKYIDIVKHLTKCNKNFSPSLSSYVNIEKYSNKIKKNAVTFEAWAANELVGLIACYLNDLEKLEGFITNVSVLEGYSNRGIGKQLLINCEEYADDQNFRCLSLELEESNERAMSLYNKNGFVFDRKIVGKYRMSKRINDNEPFVSICCATYNHEKYIGDALDGFLMQKTNFLFEILIHDDASTDGTAKIIEEYEKKYPSIVKPIYQTENQYSQDVSISATYNFPRAKGKYIALCEGDDFWTEPNKLQTQVDYLEEHPNYSACFHPINWVESKKKNNTIYAPTIEKEYYDEDNVFENILQITLCSTVLRTTTLKNHLADFKTIPYADNLIHILNARNGYIGYIPKVMATYRRHAGGIYSGASEYIRIMNTIRSLDFIKNKFAYHDNKFLENRLKTLYQELSLQSQKLCKSSSIEYQKNKFSKIVRAKSQNNATKLFSVALQKFTGKHFTAAEKILQKYKTKINYDCFERHDNRINGKPTLSIVVVAYNTNELLIECLHSVFKNQSEDYELIVVDNGGNEIVEEKLKALSLLYVKCPINFILSEGRNIGVHFTKGKLVAFLDDDALVPQNYVTSIKNTFDTYDVCAVRGKVLPKTDNENNMKANHYDLGDLAVPDTIQTEGNSVFRKDIYTEFNGMNPLLFGGEGTELSYRIYKVYGQYATIYSPEIIIYHDYAFTDDKLSIKEARHKLMRDFSSYLHPEIREYISSTQKFYSDDIKKYYSEASIPRKNSPKGEKFISVCIITYNSVKFIEDAVESVLNQTYQNFEIIIVDDGSDDGTANLIGMIESQKIKYITQDHKGAPTARNRAIHEASGEYILWLDSDDILLPRTLENYIEVMKEYSDADVYYGNLFIVDQGEKYLNKFIYPDYYNQKGELNAMTIRSSPIPNGATLINKRIFEVVGNYNEDFTRAHDYEFWSRAIDHAKFKHVNNFVAQYRWHDNNISKRDKKPDRSFEVNIIERLLSENPISNFIPKELIEPQDEAELLFQIAKKFEQYDHLYKSKEYAKMSLEFDSSNIASRYLNRINKLIDWIEKGEYKFISICIPTHNRGDYIAQTIQSALNQNYNDYEIVIVDDGSTDNTREIINSLNSAKIKYIYKERTGASDTRNRCIDESKGEFILWLDSDDLLEENILQNYVELINEYKNVDVIYGELISFGKSTRHYKYEDWYGRNEDMIEFLLSGSPMPHGGALIRKYVYEQIGKYDTFFTRAHDYEFWSRLAVNEIFSCKYLPLVTYNYRIHDNNITGELNTNTDYKFETKILKNIVDNSGIKKLFPQFDWHENELESTYNAYLNISIKFFSWKSIEEALEYLSISLDYNFDSSHQKLFNTIISKQSIRNAYPSLFNKVLNKIERWHNPSQNGEKSVVNQFMQKSIDENYEQIVNISMITYNRLEYTKKSIESVIKYTNYPYVLTVIDNNSQDGTKEYLNELKENGIIKNLVLLEENVGVAKASNLGWSLEPNAMYYLKLDNDIVLEKFNWLENLVNTIEKIPNAGAIAYNFEPESYAVTEINGLKVRVKEEGNLGGACILIPKRTEAKLGVWNEDYGLYGEEDADYGFRMKLKGLLNVYMEDEDIGKHLPGGKAALIDPKTLKAINYEESFYEKDYREWKDDLRLKNVKNGKYHKVINEYSRGSKKLYYSSNFVYENSIKYKLNNCRVSIIIPVFNKAEFTDKCLALIYNSKNHAEYEVIVVDNNSTDDTSAIVSKYINIGKNLKYIQNSSNLGFAKANNLGVSRSTNEYIMLLNNDTEVTDGWIDELLLTLMKEDSIAAVGAKLLFEDNTIQHAGVAIINDSKYGDPLVARHCHYKIDKDDPVVNIATEYQALTAACLLLRKSAYKEVQGFDEDYWNGYEDVDLCFKLREKGYKLIYQPRSVVYHLESQSGPERFTKVKENITRLHKKWLNKITPDYEISKEGEIEQVTPSQIKPYSSELNEPENIITCSIVAPLYNQVHYTKKFLDSIYSQTGNNIETILIDNNSTDETKELLKEFSENVKNIKVIYNDENFGFPKAVNQGINESVGKYVLIANNDILVTDGWLDRMIEVAESDESIGIVGPISNSVSGVQLDKNAKYESIESMYEYAKVVTEKNKGQIEEFPRVAFLCTLIKKEVIDKIGGLDERFSPGNFEDDDFCLRAQLAGYKTVIAKDVFIHHFGSVSFKADGNNKYLERLEINKQKFVSKWGADPEEIWLKGKSIRKRSYVYPLNNDRNLPLKRALVELEAQDYDLTLEYLEQVLSSYTPEIYPDLSLENLANLMANTALMNNDLEKAQQYFEEELNTNNNSSRACFGLAQVFNEAGMLNEAKTMCEFAIANDANNQEAIKCLPEINAQLNLEPAHNSLVLENIEK